jgi:hypothetical protein
MTKWVVVALCAGAFAAGPAAAQSSNSNAGAAQGMADVLSGTPGIGGIAPSVSGKNAPGGPSNSGWGNTGSKATTGTSVSRGGRDKN